MPELSRNRQPADQSRATGPVPGESWGESWGESGLSETVHGRVVQIRTTLETQLGHKPGIVENALVLFARAGSGAETPLPFPVAALWCDTGVDVRLRDVATDEFRRAIAGGDLGTIEIGGLVFEGDEIGDLVRPRLSGGGLLLGHIAEEKAALLWSEEEGFLIGGFPAGWDEAEGLEEDGTSGSEDGRGHAGPSLTPGREPGGTA